MPNLNDSLPQIAPQQNTPQVPVQPIEPITNVQNVSSDLASAEHAALGVGGGGGGGASLKSRLPIKQILVVLVLFVVFVLSYLVYFVILPSTQVGSYVEQTSADYVNLKEKLGAAKNSESTDTTASFEISKGVYFDVLQTLIFVHSVATLDAKEDLDKVRTIQGAIADARTGREKYRVASSIRELDRTYTDYLDKLDQGIGGLIDYGNYRLSILGAIGEEQAKENEKLLGVYVETTDREQKLTYVGKLAELTKQSAGKLKEVSPIPDDSRVFHEQLVISYEDMGATLDSMRMSYEAGTSEGDSEALLKLSEFGKRQIERYGKVQAENFKILENSGLKTTFAEVLVLEGKLDEEFSKYKE